MDRRAVAVTVVVAAAFAVVALVVDEPGRTPAIQALTYVLAWRVTLLIYTGRKRDRRVILVLPLLGGLWIGEWWAIALGSVNVTHAFVFGPRRDRPTEPATARELLAFAAIEASLIAIGVAGRRLVG